MSNITVDFKVDGMVGTNVYLICNNDIKECVLVDPAESCEVISKLIEKSGCRLKGVLLTHGHFDHIGAAIEIKEKYGVEIYASEHEKAVLERPNINLSMGYGMNLSISADRWLRDYEKINLAGMEIECIHTPGHTEGGMCYYIKDASILMSGDTLFCESVGRTDFPTGSMKTIVGSIKDKLFCLPDETVVYPGHGEGTSIKHEKMCNPFCI